MSLDLLATVLLMQPSVLLVFTTVWTHSFEFKLFSTMNPQSCFLSSHLPASVVARGMAQHLPLSSVMLLSAKELLWWCFLHGSVFTSVSSPAF